MPRASPYAAAAGTARRKTNATCPRNAVRIAQGPGCTGPRAFVDEPGRVRQRATAFIYPEGIPARRQGHVHRLGSLAQGRAGGLRDDQLGLAIARQQHPRDIRPKRGAGLIDQIMEEALLGASANNRFTASNIPAASAGGAKGLTPSFKEGGAWSRSQTGDKGSGRQRNRKACRAAARFE